MVSGDFIKNVKNYPPYNWALAKVRKDFNAIAHARTHASLILIIPIPWLIDSIRQITMRETTRTPRNDESHQLVSNVAQLGLLP